MAESKQVALMNAVLSDDLDEVQKALDGGGDPAVALTTAEYSTRSSLAQYSVGPVPGGPRTWPDIKSDQKISELSWKKIGLEKHTRQKLSGGMVFYDYFNYRHRL